MNSGSRRQRLVLVADPQRLRLLIQRAIDARFGGNVSRAASLIGISQPQLSRLAKRGARHLRVRSLQSLARLFTADQKPSLNQCVMSPLTRVTLTGFAAWLGLPVRSAGEWLRVYRGDRWADEQRGLALVSGQARARMRVEIALRSRFKELFDSLDRTLVAQGHFSHRVALAYHRIFDGLFEHESSGGIERRWTDLSPGDLRTYLKAGIGRERILLKRSPDLQRAQELTLMGSPIYGRRRRSRETGRGD